MGNPENLVYPSIAVVAWLVAARMLVAQRKQPSLQRGLLISGIAVAGLSYAVAGPRWYHMVDAALGVPNLAVVIVYGGVTGFTTLLAMFLAIIVYGRDNARARIAAWAAAYAVFLVGLIVLFALADVPRDAEGSTGFDTMYANAPYASAFLVLYQLGFAAGIVLIGPYWWQWSKQSDRVWMRRGLRLIAIGSPLALLYALPKLAYVALRQMGIDMEVLSKLAPLGAVGAAACYLVGFSLCSFGPVSDFRRRWRAYQEIHPLWQIMLAPFPDLVLKGMEGPADPRWAVFPRRLQTLLYRRIMEIRDARLRLKPYFDLQTVDAAQQRATDAQLSEMDSDALVEAALLQAALAAFAAGLPPADDASPVDDTGQRWNADGTHAAETRWWAAVAAQFQLMTHGGPLTVSEPA